MNDEAAVQALTTVVAACDDALKALDRTDETTSLRFLLNTTRDAAVEVAKSSAHRRPLARAL